MASDMFSIQPPALAPQTGPKVGDIAVADAPAGAFAAVLAQTGAAAPQVAAGQGFADGMDVGLLGSQWAAVNVSPALRVITDGQMEVPADALIAFAQQQGLSSEAVQALSLQVQSGAGEPVDVAVPLRAFASLPMGQSLLMAPETLTAGTPGAVQALRLQVQSGAGESVDASTSLRALVSQPSSAAPGTVTAGMNVSAQGAKVVSVPVGAPLLSETQQGVLSAGAARPHSPQVSFGASVGGRPSWAPTQAITSVPHSALAPAASFLAMPGVSVAAEGVTLQNAAPATAGGTVMPSTVVAGSLAAAPEVLEVLVRRLADDGEASLVGRGQLALAGRAVASTDGGLTQQSLAQLPQMGVAALPTQTAFKLFAGRAIPSQARQAPETEAADVLVLDEVAAQDVKDLIGQVPSLSRHAHAPATAAAIQTPTHGATTAPGSSTTAASMPGDTQAKYEAVAEKLGEAIGQRLQAQIQRGHWQVSLRLHPQELGSIDVQLGMRGGDLVAQFQASQQMTRDMLQDQMPRLREMLSGAGIDVASADVGSQSGGRSGGNPTPSQGGADSRSAPVGGDGGSSVSASGGVRVAAPGQTGDDGLDLWA